MSFVRLLLCLAGAAIPALAAEPLSFEVASIRVSPPGTFTPPSFPLDSGNAYKNTGGRFSNDFPLLVYIQFAWKIRLTREQAQNFLAPLPKWVTSDSFIIQAKAADGNATKDQMREMMKSLLADRFHLALHFETHEAPVLALVPMKPGKMGPKLRPHSEGPACDAPVGPEVFPPVCDAVQLTRNAQGTNHAGSRNTTMDQLALTLPTLSQLGRPVVDRTGFEGPVDFSLEWTAESNGDPQPDLQAVSFIDALRDQLGLKLENAKAPLQLPVVDRIERPTEN
jgi:uncharacterized protein (TIGR03435 family)